MAKKGTPKTSGRPYERSPASSPPLVEAANASDQVTQSPVPDSACQSSSEEAPSVASADAPSAPYQPPTSAGSARLPVHSVPCLGSGRPVSASHLVEEIYDWIDLFKEGTEPMSGLPTGFIDLDERMAGLHRAELVVIGGRPGAGKSAFVENLVRQLALDGGHGVYVVSLEQPSTKFVERIFANAARVDWHKLRKGLIGFDGMERLIKIGRKLKEAKVFVTDSPRQGVADIAGDAYELAGNPGIRAVVIDSIHLIRPADPAEPRHEQIGRIARDLKVLARELDLPVIVTAEASRASEDRGDRKPRLADLRESAAIGEVADSVLLLHRPEMYEYGQHEGIVEVNIAKQRNGPTGEVVLTYVKECMRFENFAVEAPFAYDR